MTELARERIDLAIAQQLEEGKHWFAIGGILYVCSTFADDVGMSWEKFITNLRMARKLILDMEARGGVCSAKIYREDAYLLLEGGGYALRGGLNVQQFVTAVKRGVEVFDPNGIIYL